MGPYRHPAPGINGRDIDELPSLYRKRLRFNEYLHGKAWTQGRDEVQHHGPVARPVSGREEAGHLKWNVKNTIITMK